MLRLGLDLMESANRASRRIAMDSERRQSSRGILLTEVQYEGAGIRAETRISDINLSGVFIDALSPLPVGAALKVAFTLPGGHRVATEGIVVHSQPRIGMGVEFASLKPEDAKLIQEALDSHR
jgi:hypothetical protein